MGIISLAAPDPQKEGLGGLNTKKLTAAGMFAAPIKSRHIKSVMSYNPLTIFLSREGILIEIENCIDARRERAFFAINNTTRFHIIRDNRPMRCYIRVCLTTRMVPLYQSLLLF